jgi:hypothetical protein
LKKNQIFSIIVSPRGFSKLLNNAALIEVV